LKPQLLSLTDIAHRLGRFPLASLTHWVLDFGGGFGTLGREIASLAPEATVEVFEPFPSEYALNKSEPFVNLRYVDAPSGQYDLVVCLDVLEHLVEPLAALETLAGCVADGGGAVVGNCFYPVIKCHLPATFHLRHAFDVFAYTFGLRYRGLCSGTYAKNSCAALSLTLVRALSQCSNLLFETTRPPAKIVRMLRDEWAHSLANASCSEGVAK
jgi:SAM-dependent methyltransferase